MKNALYNAGYFFNEAKRVISFNPLSGIFSFVSTGLILFILALVITGWGVGTQLVEIMQEEAEISAYFDGSMQEKEALSLINMIKGIEGVWDARLVDGDEAYSRMENLLGEEAHVLGFFEENPFEPFIEARIHLKDLETVAERIGSLPGIDYIRENKEVLGYIQNITEGLNKLWLLIIVAVGLSTIVIISHTIRQGIYNNKVQINILRLMGAPERFIGLPFVLAGLLLTLMGGVLASVFILLLINRIYGNMVGSLPFVPLPPKTQLVTGVVISILSISTVLGVFGSLFGISSTE